MGFFKDDTLARKDVLPGIRIGSVRIENFMLTHFTFEAVALKDKP